MDGDAYRRLAEALDEISLWVRLAPLLPFAVHHDHRAERLMARIPMQRAPSEPRRAPSGSPARPNTTWGTRSARR